MRKRGVRAISQERIPHQSFPAQVLTQCHNEIARLEEETAALRQQLAERDARIANLETAVNELGTTMAQVALLESMIPPRVFQLLNDATKIAERDAVLRECRYSVKTELELLAPIDGQYRIDELTERLARIDAIVGKEGDNVAV